MSRKKKLTITAGTFIGLVTLYLIRKRFPRANGLEDLTPEEREDVSKEVADKAVDVERVRKDAKREAEKLPPRYQGSWMRTRARGLAQKLTGDRIDFGA